jgi:uncharacterized protein
MPRKLFVNLPVTNLDASVAFFGKLGFTFDPTLTDANAASMIVNEHTSVMLLVESRFSDFTSKRIVDTADQAEVIFSFSVESREEVDELVATAIGAGGSPVGEKEDHGFMYSWSFQDIDGHLWGVLYWDAAAFAAMQQQ